MAAHAGRTEEEGVAEESDGDVDVAQTAEKAIAAEGVVGPACVAEEEEDKYDIADSAEVGAWLDLMVIVVGRSGFEYDGVGRLVFREYLQV